MVAPLESSVPTQTGTGSAPAGNAAPSAAGPDDGPVSGAQAAPLRLDGLVSGDRVRLCEDPFHVLTLTVDGRTHENVRPLRCFPISGRADYVSFLDANGREVAIVGRLDRLDKQSRRVLQRALDRMYYVPQIQRIDSITESLGISHWRVLTDRGYAQFEVVDPEYIRRLPGNRLVIEDADGNRFEVRDASRLDARSRALLEGEM